MKKKLTILLVWIFIFCACIYFFSIFSQSDKSLPFESFETFLNDVQQDLVSEIRINNNEITVTALLNDTYHEYRTIGLIDNEVMKMLSERGIYIQWGEESKGVSNIFCYVVLFLIIALLIFYVLYKSGAGAGAGSNNIFSFSKLKLQELQKSEHITFDNVGGCREAKEMLNDIIDFFKNPDRWIKSGVRIPRGILLEGPPGCGKTLLARAVAGESKANFYFISASEFVEMFVGVGAARIRSLFEQASKKTPAILFIDELDAVGRRRGSGIGASHDEREQTLNQLLVSLDGIAPKNQIIIIAATNRSDILDRALLRPGRFDRRIRVGSLTRTDRIEVIRIYLRNKTLTSDVSFEEIADRTNEWNGADLENLVNEAALCALRRANRLNEKEARVSAQDFWDIIKKIESRSFNYNTLDALLVESTSQLSTPSKKIIACLTLTDGALVEGKIMWVDASFIKLKNHESGQEIVIAKEHVLRIEALECEKITSLEELNPDKWARHHLDCA
ncbi:MAG: AAA family ATPase [bacterium]